MRSVESTLINMIKDIFFYVLIAFALSNVNADSSIDLTDFMRIEICPTDEMMKIFGRDEAPGAKVALEKCRKSPISASEAQNVIMEIVKACRDVCQKSPSTTNVAFSQANHEQKSCLSRCEKVRNDQDKVTFYIKGFVAGNSKCGAPEVPPAQTTGQGAR